MHLGISVNDVARALLEFTAHAGQIGEFMEIVVALLHAALRVVDGARIEAHRSTRLHAVGGKSHRTELFGYAMTCRLGDAAAGHLHASDMHQSVQESSSG